LEEVPDGRVVTVKLTFDGFQALRERMIGFKDPAQANRRADDLSAG